MELHHIRYFLTVAEEGSFTRAAEKLHIAQPPLSRQIRDLEEELGTPLFDRRARGLILTEAGQRFRQYAGQIQYLADQSVEDMKEMKTGLRGTLYLATVEGRAPQLLSEWIAGFHEIYPHVQYNLWNGNSDDVIGRVNKGLCDLAIITAPYDQEGLEGAQIYEEPWVAMIPGDHPLAKEKGDSIDLSKLAPYELLIPSRQSRLREIEGWFSPLHEKPKILCRIAHMLNAYELTAQGLGIAIFPEAAAVYAREGVVIKKIKNPAVTAKYVLVRQSGREATLVASEFWDHIVASPAE
ncbi:MAG: LysR family transcriptional regulator [Lachnospiraceae bacterium]|nr:LysR family transcriptional regulator [Lachnospiraceae bacterium]